MGIVNVTPDSFSGDGVWDRDVISNVLHKVENFLKDGATIIDIGGESTRPSAQDIPLEEEKKRVVPVIEAIAKEFPEALFSIDTKKPEIAQIALDHGAFIINDVSGTLASEKMGYLAKEYGAKIVVMHAWPHLRPSQLSAEHPYTQTPTIILSELQQLVNRLKSIGLHQHQIIIDPGIGFGKTTQEDLAIINNLHLFKSMNADILIGASRKKFIGNITGLPVDQRLSASLAINIVAFLYGATILRVHDVAETYQALTIIHALQKNIAPSTQQ